MNGYGASLTILTGFDCFRKIRPTLLVRVAAVVASVLIWFIIGAAISGTAVNAFYTSLTLMLYLLIPWSATNLIDFFFVRKGHYAIMDLFTPSGIYGSCNWRGLTAFAAGFVAEIPFMVLPSPINYTGPAANALSSVDISWIAGLIVTVLVYWILSRSMNLQAEIPAIEMSEQELKRQVDSAGVPIVIEIPEAVSTWLADGDSSVNDE